MSINEKKMIRDATGSPIPQHYNEEEGIFIANTNGTGDADGVDFTKKKMIRDAIGAVIPQYYDVEEDRFMPLTSEGTAGGGGNFKLGNVENLTAVAVQGGKAVIKWKDPKDIIVEGVTLAKWAGTVVRRKLGTYPINNKDGELVVDSKARNQYETIGYEDSGLVDGETYYYALFPYTDGNLYTVDVANRVSVVAFDKYTQAPPTKPVATGLQQNKAVITSSNGAVVSLDKTDWFSSPHEFSGLTEGTSYTPYAKFLETSTHKESDIVEGDTFTAVNKLPKAPPTFLSVGSIGQNKATVTSEAGAVVSLNQTQWFNSPHEFTGLTVETNYTAYAKFPETSTHVESGVIDKAFTTASAVSIYGVKIDTSNSNPETAVTYTDDAVGFTPMRLQGGVINMGSWADKYPFNEIKAVVVKNGVEQYELNPNDYTKKKDGTASDITSGNDGDVFVRFSPLWWKFETIGTDLYVKMATAPVVGFKKLAHTKAGQDMNYAYIGAYLGFVDGSNKLRSLSGKTVTANQTIGTFRTQAQSNGNGYTQFDYYKLLMIQVMLLIATKSRDSQTALGRGYVDGNSGYVTTGGTDKKGLNFGETTGKLQNKIFGIEDFWGNYYQWIDGLFCNENFNILIGDNNFNDTGNGYANYGEGATANVGGYIKNVQGGTETGFIVKEGTGSDTTFYSDYGYLYSGRLPYFGGSRSVGSGAGAFRLDVSRAAGAAYADFASRACFVK